MLYDSYKSICNVFNMGNILLHVWLPIVKVEMIFNVYAPLK